MSAAYYALFHLLVSEATSRFVSGAGREPLRKSLGRAFGHADMKTASQGFAAGNPTPKIGRALSGQPIQAELRNVARRFVELQQARHEADYDLTCRFTRQESLDFIEQVEQAFRDWKVIRKTLPADAYLVALLAQKSMRA